MGRQAAAGADIDAIESFWRSLRFFSTYRLAIALLFVAASLIVGDTVSLGTQDPLLFDRVAAVYLLASIVFLVVLLALQTRPLGRLGVGLVVLSIAVNTFGALTFDRSPQFYRGDAEAYRALVHD